MSEKLPEAALKQELGPKKYQDKVDKANAFYDKYKAGKRDPKTGVYYHPISFTDPRKSKIGSGSSVGCFACPNPNCDHGISVKRTTAGVLCAGCKQFISVSVDKLTDEVTLTLKEVNKPDRE